MKKTLLAAASVLALTAAAQAEDVKMGIILGFTGPIESLTPDMAAGAEMAISEANESGQFLGGMTIEPVRADSTCVDAAAATAAAERLITSDGVVSIMGADCSGVTTAVANNAAIPNGVVMISPSATSPALTTIEDNGLFFRTAPSDARQGEVLAEVVMGNGVESIAITYTNNDYGKGLADSFQSAFEAMGGTVTITAAHEDGRGDYSAEVGALASAGGDALAVLGYVDQGGRGIMEGAIDTGAFETFYLGDGMIGDSLLDLPGLGDVTTIGTAPGAEGDFVDTFNAMFAEAVGDGSGPYRGESYDAAALMILAMQKAGEADRGAIAGNIMDLANAPGEPIGPGELGKALEMVAAGTDIDYVGATNVEFTDVGEAAGTYRVLQVTDGAWETLEVK
ncbi:MAG: ABC transporter substrate-binding protein [Roseitalea sp.]|jgi:branched-chain amino acid transport system substrate-binding protein|uniref:Branched-chain amino acid ABC transporter substrate-binding protein n=1 Tax=Oceaniradius stylonematis TaxID=2184161 RepID=A0A3A8AN05_9HYPH|nr:ABC transporter substrate-binding protein [Oceaniradius stylonematis]MBO6553679.1 ABC transporter substrate-binding protein [Roseitalea sp.]MBO6952722.1 ABC transporter substrate-binding protein [Rhizobiaceae bacterium]RNC96419.1 MAG: branched-chain amino acid ABC transporter substrate-binding protein [Oricola sp.]MBO6592791.1 ABC transporter substrate-binding protein [Roseitalea sp.]MBO6600466.1 ABC transporter substrate-binding protein [Roseitalea sp.]